MVTIIQGGVIWGGIKLEKLLLYITSGLCRRIILKETPPFMLWFIVLTFEYEKWFGEILVFGKLLSINAVNGFYDHDIVNSGYKNR